MCPMWLFVRQGANPYFWSWALKTLTFVSHAAAATETGTFFKILTWLPFARLVTTTFTSPFCSDAPAAPGGAGHGGGHTKSSAGNGESRQFLF